MEVQRVRFLSGLRRIVPETFNFDSNLGGVGVGGSVLSDLF